MRVHTAPSRRGEGGRRRQGNQARRGRGGGRNEKRRGPVTFSVQTAVVYISHVNELRRGGTSIEQAAREGAILRLRPIMMTALVAALATGVGTDSQRPFALVIVSGLFSRLLISVFLMPALYLLVARPGDRLEV